MSAVILPGALNSNNSEENDSGNGIFAGNSALDDILSKGGGSSKELNSGQASNLGATAPPPSTDTNSSDGYQLFGNLHVPGAPPNSMANATSNNIYNAYRMSSESMRPRSQRYAGIRVSVQDLEGDQKGAIILLLPPSLDVLLMMVSSRFGYKQKYCHLFSRWGAIIDDLSLIKDDDLLFSSDGKEFPHSMRPVMEESMYGGTTEGAQSARNKGPHPTQSLERFDIWGWPRIGQILGADRVRYRLYQSWRTSGSVGAVLFLVNFVAFLFPPTCTGRGVCHVGNEEANPQAVQAYFWFFALGTLSSLTSIIMASMLTMQLNLVPQNKDVFWFLKEYGNWLVGYPTTFLVMAVTLMFGGFLASASLTYQLEYHTWALIGIFIFAGVVLIVMSLMLSARSWARVNGMSLHKIWPEDPYVIEHMFSEGATITNGHTPAGDMDSAEEPVLPFSNYQSNTSSVLSNNHHMNSAAVKFPSHHHDLAASKAPVAHS